MSAYSKAVELGLEGLHAVSTGTCPGCDECRSALGFATTEELRDAWARCEADTEPSFSWRACDVCGTSLGGDREVWHALDADNAILHFDSCCTDCVQYLAYGTEPEQWRSRP